MALRERWSCDTNAHPACSREILCLLFSDSNFRSHTCSFPGSSSLHLTASVPPLILSLRAEPRLPRRGLRVKTTERRGPPGFLERPAAQARLHTPCGRRGCGTARDVTDVGPCGEAGGSQAFRGGAWGREGDRGGPGQSGFLCVGRGVGAWNPGLVTTRGAERVEPAPAAAQWNDCPGRLLPEVVGRVSWRCG